jgi:hypothetical protein
MLDLKQTSTIKIQAEIPTIDLTRHNVLTVGAMFTKGKIEPAAGYTGSLGKINTYQLAGSQSAAYVGVGFKFKNIIGKVIETHNSYLQQTPCYLNWWAGFVLFYKQFWQYLIFTIYTIVPFNGIHFLIDNNYQKVYIYLKDNILVRKE